MCEVGANGTLAFVFVAKEDTIKYAQVVSESLGIPLLAVALDDEGETKIKEVRKKKKGNLTAKLTVDVGKEILGGRYIVSFLDKTPSYRGSKLVTPEFFDNFNLWHTLSRKML